MLRGMPGATLQHVMQVGRPEVGFDLARRIGTLRRESGADGSRTRREAVPLEFAVRNGTGHDPVEGLPGFHYEIAGRDLHDVVRQRQQRPIAVRQLAGETFDGKLPGKPHGRLQDVPQAFDQNLRGQRRTRPVGESQELGDPPQVCTTNAGSALRDGGYEFAADLGEAGRRLGIVGDVPGNVVDLTGRQELLEPQTTRSPGLPEDFDVGQASS